MGGFFASAVTAVRMCESLRGPRFFKEGWTLKSFEVIKVSTTGQTWGP